ncbi:hypothetical protein IFR04_005583 [Cadophora malorum]|uniref:Uncharacterized protein n=1 Tax=Cadophora malorum TaxID=108018 RepID=A0A8H7TLU7_9HELO|nr:hypothetical protein IFR04_005583 [Cadophora malorum]
MAYAEPIHEGPRQTSSGSTSSSISQDTYNDLADLEIAASNGDPPALQKENFQRIIGDKDLSEPAARARRRPFKDFERVQTAD